MEPLEAEGRQREDDSDQRRQSDAPVRFQLSRADGRKELYAKKSGTTIRVISPPRKAYAKKA